MSKPPPLEQLEQYDQPQVVNLTTDLAETILDIRVDYQRPVSEALVKQLTADIRNDRWRFLADGILILTDPDTGEWIGSTEGQHRSLARQAADDIPDDVQVPVVLVFKPSDPDNKIDESFEAAGTGKARLLRDNLKSQKVPFAGATASLIRSCAETDNNNGIYTKKTNLSRGELLAWWRNADKYHALEAARQAARTANQVRVPPGVTSAFIYLCMRDVGFKKTIDFWTLVTRPDPIINDKHPALMLRSQFMAWNYRLSSEGSRVGSVMRWNTMAKAWHRFLENTEGPIRWHVKEGPYRVIPDDWTD